MVDIFHRTIRDRLFFEQNSPLAILTLTLDIHYWHTAGILVLYTADQNPLTGFTESSQCLMVRVAMSMFTDRNIWDICNMIALFVDPIPR